MRRLRTLVLLLLAGCLCSSFGGLCAPALAQSTAPAVTSVGAHGPRFITEAQANVAMEVGETRLMQLEAAAIRVSVADPEVADVQVVTPHQVLITAKAVGFTHLIVWSSAEIPTVLAISSKRNLDQLREQYKKLFSGSDIQVSSVGDLIVLSGTVSDVRVPARAAEVARLHSEKVANLIQVTGDQQVQLDVRFAEVSRSGLRKMGANFLWQDGARGMVGGQSPPGVSPGSYIATDTNYIPGTNVNGAPPWVGAPDVGGVFNWFFSTATRQFPFSVILSLLSQQGLAKILAEPTLVALSGQDANFHAGGEMPILTARSLGNTSVMFKRFGVLLKFTPTVLGQQTLSLKLGLEVSEPDATSGVVLGGFTIPGFRTRSSETTVRLRDGQSFAIAGLLSDEVRHTVMKIPWLGDLPLLGALFRSTSYQRNESELLMVVTAHLVKPLQPGEVPTMPGEDEFNDPNDFELFVLGRFANDKVERKAPNANSQASIPDSSPNAAPLRVELKPHEGPIGPIGFLRD